MNNTPYSYRDPHRWMVFSVICVVYFFVYFHRVSTSVIVSDLLEAFHTNATALGFMSSLYFYLYAFEQPLVGYLSDRLGPRRVIGYWSVAAAAGCFLFGMAPNIGWASVGRAYRTWRGWCIRAGGQGLLRVVQKERICHNDRPAHVPG